MSTTDTKSEVAAELRRQAEVLVAVADRIDRAPAPLTGGSALVSQERLRQIHEEGHDEHSDRLYKGNELAWAAYCYLERAAQARLPQPDPSVPHVWPLDRRDWKPKESRIRNLVVAAALIVAEVDRRLADGDDR